MKTVILGVGNTLLSDDGVGVYIAQELAKRYIQSGEVTVKEAFSPGFELVEELVGFERAIVIDAIMVEGEPIGKILRYTPENFKNAIHISTYHDMNFPTALGLARAMKINIPQEIVIYAVTVKDITTLNEACTEEVQKAIPRAVEMILKEVNKSK